MHRKKGGGVKEHDKPPREKRERGDETARKNRPGNFYHGANAPTKGVGPEKSREQEREPTGKAGEWVGK